MAVVKVVLFNICLLCVSNLIILNVSASDLGLPVFVTYEDQQLPNAEVVRNHYRLHKRGATSPPIKKAFISSEKKSLAKPATNVHLKMLEYEASNNTANLTEVTTAVPTPNTTLAAANTSTIPSEVNSTLATTVNATTAAEVATSSSLVSSNTSLPDVTTPMDVAPTKPASITNTTEDHHVYYNSSLFLEKEKAMSFWVDFDSLPQEKVTVHRMLSDSHRKAATVGLTFDFPFYGHPLRNITIATGGFVYMGDYMHSWLAATQYIAPLMANFDTSLSNDSTVRYFDNGTAFIIEWNKVSLQDHKKGNFTFQTTLLKNGNIIFVYKVIPVSVTEIGDDAHPVKVGLSDAYVIDRVIYFIRRKTIYEYHRIDMKKEEIGNDTAIYFTALTTCINYQDCNSCMNAASGLECVWCESAKRCSDGLDRLRQDWLDSKCNVEKEAINCSLLPSPNLNPFVQPLTDSPPKVYTFPPHTHDIQDPTTYPHYQPSYRDGSSSSARVSEQSSSFGVGSVVVILLFLAVVLGGLVWVGYAYRNPHTSSGQLLIRYRPTQWRFRNGEARYTAASVHM